LGLFFPLFFLLLAPFSAVAEAPCRTVLIYAQDIAGVTPGHDNDTAIINGRDGQNLLTVAQPDDSRVIWPQTTTVRVFAGEKLNYSGAAHHRIDFDLINESGDIFRKVHFAYPTHPLIFNAEVPITENGFVRFNAGEMALEYNQLHLTRFDRDGCSRSVPVASTSPLPPSSQPLPDLITENLNVFGNLTAGENLTLSGAVRNQGNSPTAASSAKFLLDWNVIAFVPVGTLSAGATETKNINIAATFGNHIFHLCADAGAAVAESEENNNCSFRNFTVGQPAINPPPPPPPAERPNNRPFWQTAPMNFTIYTNQILQFSVLAFDPDGDPLTYDAFSLPVGATFNVATRTFTWTPMSQQIGAYTVQFQTNDGRLTSELLVTINVLFGGQLANIYPGIYPGVYDQKSYYQQPYYQQPYYQPLNFQPIYSPTFSALNLAPYFINFNPPTSVKEGQAYYYDMEAVDPNSDPLTFNLTSGPAGLAVDQRSGVISWLPNFSQGRFQPHDVTVAVRDNFQNEDRRSFQIRVVDISPSLSPSPPVAPPSPPCFCPPETAVPAITSTETSTLTAATTQTASQNWLWWFWLALLAAAAVILLIVIWRQNVRIKELRFEKRMEAALTAARIQSSAT